jgi:hypothetical protein
MQIHTRRNAHGRAKLHKQHASGLALVVNVSVEFDYTSCSLPSHYPDIGNPSISRLRTVAPIHRPQSWVVHLVGDSFLPTARGLRGTLSPTLRVNRTSCGRGCFD